MTSWVYLIHFDEPLHHARHYTGFAGDDVAVRLRRHAEGRGARLMEVITERGISWQVARVYAGNRAEERRRKRQKKPSRWCPVCKGQPAIIESDRTALAAALAGSLGRVAP